MGFLSKNLDFSNIFLGEYARKGEGILTISTCLSLKKLNFDDFIGF